MPSPTWQLNAALAIRDIPHQKRIRFGHMAPHQFEIQSHYRGIKSIIQELERQQSLQTQQIDSLGRRLGIPSKSTCQELAQLKIITPVERQTARYSRHQHYFRFAGASDQAQNRLRKASVLLIGCGGVGSTCATLLSAAGVGSLYLADNDVVEESNLTRTILFQQSDLGRKKIRQAKTHLRAKNPKIQVHLIATSLKPKTVKRFATVFSKVEMVILSGDSGPEVHKLSYGLSKQFNTPLINVGYIETFGIVGPMTTGLNRGRERELKKVQPVTKSDQVLNPQCKTASFGPLNAMVSAIAVNEVIRHLVGLSVRTHNRRMVIDSFNYKQIWERWS